MRHEHKVDVRAEIAARHRPGRTARAAASGVVVLVLSPEQAKGLRHLFGRAGVEVSPVEAWAAQVETARTATAAAASSAAPVAPPDSSPSGLTGPTGAHGGGLPPAA